MLASVTDVAEARVAWAAGADIIDLKEPVKGALGALPPSVCAAVVQALGVDVLVSAALGDDPSYFREGSRKISAVGVRLVKLGMHLHRPISLISLESLLSELRDAGVCPVIVWLIESGIPGAGILRNLAAAGAWGTMLDTAEKVGGSLPARVPESRLRSFVRDARAAGLCIGLAGGLCAADVPQLIALEPDYLGFRGALCDTGRAGRVKASRVRSLVACCNRAVSGYSRPKGRDVRSMGNGTILA